MTITLGQRLHLARESKGLSLQDISHSTRIPVPRLRDLEEDTYTTFGSLTYAKNFLKDYSQLLGVDAHEVLDEMHSPSLGGVRDYHYLVKNYGTWIRESRPDRPRSPAVPRPASMGVMAGICAALLLFGMGVLLGAAFLGGEHRPVPQPQAQVVVPVEESRPATLPETHVPAFSTPVDVSSIPVPVAEPVASPAGAKPESSFKRPVIAPGTIPKALPVEEPKHGKSRHG